LLTLFQPVGIIKTKYVLMGTQNWSISWLYLASCSVEENSGCRDFFSDWV